MFKNYIKITLRNMARYKSYTFINISGLSLGIAVCFLLCMWVKDELSYDRFHQHSDRMYRSLWEARFGDNEWKIPEVPMPLAAALENGFPEVEKTTQVYKGALTLMKAGQQIRQADVLFVDEDFFDVFTVSVIAGNPKDALSDPDAVLITPETAARYFAENDPVGKELVMEDGKVLRVAGIVSAFPEQSHLQFSMLASLERLSFLEGRKESWGSATLYTYSLLQEGTDYKQFNEKFQDWVEENIVDDEFRQGGNFTSFPLERVTDIHLLPNRPYIWMFSIIAVLILLLACINFINLTTARSVVRAREIGIRKVLGSQRHQLIKQFFGEAFLYVLAAVVFAVLLVKLTIPAFNEFSGKSLSINIFDNPFNWLLLGILVAFTTLLTGFFPALVLSGFTPLKVLKGELTAGQKSNELRQGLVVFQFSASIALIIGTLVVKEQLHFLQNQQLGFDEERVLVIKGATALDNNYGPFLNQLKSNPAIESVSASQFLPGDGFDSTIFLPEQPANYKQTSLTYSHVEAEFVNTMKFEFVAGRNFNPELSTDSSAYLLNETAARRLGWENPLGKEISYGGMETGKVIGVLKDFHITSLHEEIAPIVFRHSQFKLSNIVLRLNDGAISGQLESIRNSWKKLAQGAPLEYSFLDADFQKLYETEVRMSAVFSLFAALAIFIACLGLFGLASFMISQRSKEISIRKVLGASVLRITVLLSKDFIKLVLLAMLIGIPVAWYYLERWLSAFAYRIEIHWSVFLIAACIAIAIAMLTISFQSIKAALYNPVNALKNE